MPEFRQLKVVPIEYFAPHSNIKLVGGRPKMQSTEGNAWQSATIDQFKQSVNDRILHGVRRKHDATMAEYEIIPRMYENIPRLTSVARTYQSSGPNYVLGHTREVSPN